MVKRSGTPIDWLIESGLARSRQEALSFIHMGKVRFDGTKIFPTAYDTQYRRPKEIVVE